MKNHGILVTGDSMAQAYRWLYRLERVCRNQILAMSTGKPLNVLAPEVTRAFGGPAKWSSLRPEALRLTAADGGGSTSSVTPGLSFTPHRVTVTRPVRAQAR